MATFTDPQLARLFADAGFTGEALVTMVAVSLAEDPARDPAARGDLGLQTAKWGPSLGFAQIRSLWADYGTGRDRDPTRLTDPAFNAHAAWDISRGGADFRPWSTWTSGRFRDYLDRARAAVTGTSSTAAAPSSAASPAFAGIPGGGLVDKLVSPVLAGLGRIALVGVLVAGGVALVLAGGWRGTGHRLPVPPTPPSAMTPPEPGP